jgi:HEPN domain-containing protein
MRREIERLLAQQAVEKYLKGAWVVTRKEPALHAHAPTELGDGLDVPAELRRHLADLTSDYTVSRYPDAANAVPYELYDLSTAQAKVQNAEAVITWLRARIAS